MAMEAEAPVKCVNTTRGRTENPSTAKSKDIGLMKVRHQCMFCNDLPLWAAARVRELKPHNPAASKLAKKHGLSGPMARAIAEIHGLGPRGER